MSVTIGPAEPIVPVNDTVLLTNKTTSQFLGDEMGLALKSDVPTKTSELDNDSDFATNASVNEKIGDVTSSIPTKTSQLNNDSDFATNTSVDEKIGGVTSSIPTKVSQLNNDSDFATNASVDEKIGGVTSSIPTKTSQLDNDSNFANKDFVNSSIATNTANFKGTFNNESEFPTDATNNDYLFWNTVDENGNTIYKRYKYVASTSTWTYEYTLNNSSFTAEQWATINGGPYATQTSLNGKQDKLPYNDVWDVYDVGCWNAVNATRDVNGKDIDATYATKEELNNAIGNVLTQEVF